MAKKYSTCVREAGLKINDRVKVVRKTNNRANGWDGMWNPLMTGYVGKTGTITTNPEVSGGVQIRFDGDTQPSTFQFPVFILHKQIGNDAELLITATEVRMWIKDPNVCASWKSDIKDEFDIYTADTFQADAQFIIDGYEAANETIKERLKARFPITITEYIGEVWYIEDGYERDDVISSIDDAIRCSMSEEFFNLVPGQTGMDKAETILELLLATYKQK